MSRLPLLTVVGRKRQFLGIIECCRVQVTMHMATLQLASLARSQRGHFVHFFDLSGLSACLSAGDPSSATEDIGAAVPDHVPIGPSLTTTVVSLCHDSPLVEVTTVVLPIGPDLLQ